MQRAFFKRLKEEKKKKKNHLIVITVLPNMDKGFRRGKKIILKISYEGYARY